MWQAPYPLFDARPPPIQHNGGWGTPIVSAPLAKPEWHSDIAKKQAFGTRLGKGDRPLDAALFVFASQSDALWAVSNWLRDPIVIETREAVEKEINLLDKDQLLVKLLKFADEKSPQGFPIHEGKDRLSALKLYAEIQGYLAKVNINTGIVTNNDNRMEIILIKPPEKQIAEKVIEHTADDEVYDLGVELKLVG